MSFVIKGFEPIPYKEYAGFSQSVLEEDYTNNEKTRDTRMDINKLIKYSKEGLLKKGDLYIWNYSETTWRGLVADFIGHIIERTF